MRWRLQSTTQPLWMLCEQRAVHQWELVQRLGSPALPPFPPSRHSFCPSLTSILYPTIPPFSTPSPADDSSPGSMANRAWDQQTQVTRQKDRSKHRKIWDKALHAQLCLLKKFNRDQLMVYGGGGRKCLTQHLPLETNILHKWTGLIGFMAFFLQLWIKMTMDVCENLPICQPAWEMPCALLSVCLQMEIRRYWRASPFQYGPYVLTDLWGLMQSYHRRQLFVAKTENMFLLFFLIFLNSESMNISTAS